ncbi:MAG: DUF1957 domain-containing protein [Candidatus Omnitrophica bacterium]|nr:DUF1957 domain-containing protein [Candidatus Omnitrophota bacterium]
MPQGYLALVLHAHLPYVRHPEDEHFLEERWLYEAITETYLPLLEMLERLLNDGVPFRLSLSLTPTLLSMLADGLLRDRYVRHLERLLELVEKECHRTQHDAAVHRLAVMYRDRFRAAHDQFTRRYRRDLIRAFDAVGRSGSVELMTSCATHGYLPMLHVQPLATRAQVAVGVQTFEQCFGRRPRGIWLPECGFDQSEDSVLKEHGIRFFLTDAHGILFGSPRPKFGVFAPVYCPSGVAAFGRDLETSKSVWSAIEGYPGDFDYREFYRDIGYDLEHEYLRPYLNGDGARTNTGIKYYRITGRTEHKAPYDPDRAREKAAEHAGNFLFNRERQVEYLQGIMGREPIIVSPYDAELFGHWWFEGPLWLEFLIRKMAYDQETVKLITPTEYLERYPRNQRLVPAQSSWGYKGYSEVWLNGANDWLYRHLHHSLDRMADAARRHPAAEGLTLRALNQMARELLLMQSSDWAFIMKTGHHVAYAHRRFKEHLARFTTLDELLQAGRVDEPWLASVEAVDNVFPTIDYRIYQ